MHSIEQSHVAAIASETIKLVNAQLSDRVKSLEAVNEQLRSRVDTIELDQDRSQQYSRRNSLRISEKPILEAILGELRDYAKTKEIVASTEPSTTSIVKGNNIDSTNVPDDSHVDYHYIKIGIPRNNTVKNHHVETHQHVASHEHEASHEHAVSDGHAASHGHIVTNQHTPVSHDTPTQSQDAIAPSINLDSTLPPNLRPVKIESREKNVLAEGMNLHKHGIESSISPDIREKLIISDVANTNQLDSKRKEIVTSFLKFLKSTGKLSLVKDILSETQKDANIPIFQTTHSESGRKVDYPTLDVAMLNDKHDIVKLDLQAVSSSAGNDYQDVKNGEVQPSPIVLSEQKTNERVKSHQSESLQGIINELTLSESDISKLRDFGGKSPIIILQVNKECNQTVDNYDLTTSAAVKPEVLQSAVKESTEPTAEYKKMVDDMTREQLHPPRPITSNKNVPYPSRRIPLQESRQPSTVTTRLIPLSKPSGTKNDVVVVTTEMLSESSDVPTGHVKKNIPRVLDEIKVITTTADKGRQYLSNQVRESSPVFTPLRPHQPYIQSNRENKPDSLIPVIVINPDYGRANIQSNNINTARGNTIMKLQESQQPNIISTRVTQTSALNDNVNYDDTYFRQSRVVNNDIHQDIPEVQVRTVSPRYNGDNQPIVRNGVKVVTKPRNRQSVTRPRIQPTMERASGRPVGRNPIVVVTKPAYLHEDLPITNRFAYNIQTNADHRRQQIPNTNTQFNVWEQQPSTFQATRDMNPMEGMQPHQLPNTPIGMRWE
ncbi:hypothetical protein ACF0H5_005206 [Mactra antiquata]